ncbi:MAG TPA: aldose epimerase family protein [Beijerinckiaceae bacterium]
MTIARIGSVGGRDIEEVVLRSAAGAEAKVITFGAIVRDLTVPTPRGPQRVVLGLDDLEGYATVARHMGAIVGRYGNRIGGGRFVLDGETFRLDLNENRLDPAGPGRQHLHGGARGFSQRAWTIVDHTAASVTLALVSQDGDMGYPGRLVATCTYTLAEPATLRLVLEATSDRPTPVNLTTHLYYNLDGSPDILDHTLEIAAGHVTPTDEELIPTGEVLSVAGTPYDFRTPRPIREGMRGGGAAVDYDVNYVLSGPRGSLNRAATLASDKSGVALELWTTEPGVQFYGGHKLAVPAGALGGGAYGRHGGLCLEPQRFPDGPNHPHFPPCILRPGEVSRQASELRFSAR